MTTSFPVSSKLFQRAQRLIPGGVNSPVRAFRNVGMNPFYTQSANGCRLTTPDGNEFIDYVLTWGPAIFGHNDPEIRAAVHAAVDCGLGFGTNAPAEVRMAELITQTVPAVEKVRMTNSGTEATMSAIRLARGFTQRTKIVKFAGGYHGHVDSLLVKSGSGAMTFGQPDSLGVTPGTAADTFVLPYNDFDAAEKLFAERGNEIAAIIVEPFLGNIGFIMPEPGFLAKLRELTARCGALLIFDEVMTGFRISLQGTMGVHEVRPDLVCLGKIIGGGLPVGAFGGRAEIMDCLAPLGGVYQAGTFCGHPVSLAAGVAALEKLIREKSVYEKLSAFGKTLAGELTRTARERGIALQVPHCGGMFALFFNENPVRNLEQATQSDPEKAKKLFRYAIENGVFLPPSPYESCFISTAHDEAALEKTVRVLCDGLRTL
ncbi:MAG: glutamate-1-semialdehyde 2,1-aminomutase [Opitutales bacterium]|nr:glutamate-1-semialdehyde 2,1-aminomutase [Opitutales bacterium]